MVASAEGGLALGLFWYSTPPRTSAKIFLSCGLAFPSTPPSTVCTCTPASLGSLLQWHAQLSLKLYTTHDPWNLCKHTPKQLPRLPFYASFRRLHMHACQPGVMIAVTSPAQPKVDSTHDPWNLCKHIPEQLPWLPLRCDLLPCGRIQSIVIITGYTLSNLAMHHCRSRGGCAGYIQVMQASK